MTLPVVGHARPVIDTTTLTRTDWLDARRSGIGGSDAACVCGLDQWRSPFELFLDRTGVLPDDDAGEAALLGRLIEPVIADELARREQIEVHEVGWMLAHPDHPWMLADLDRIAVDHDDDDAVVEIKTTSAFRAGDWRDGIPVAVMCQVQHYLAVTGLDRAIVVALIGGQRLVVHRVQRDDALIASLIGVEERFWQSVLNREPPPVDGSKATTDLLARLYEVDAADVVTVDRAEVEPYLAALAQARARQDAAEADRRVAENEIKIRMGGSPLLVDVDGQPVARWPAVETRRIDLERLRAEEPDIAAKYTTVTTSRRFTIVK